MSRMNFLLLGKRVLVKKGCYRKLYKMKCSYCLRPLHNNRDLIWLFTVSLFVTSSQRNQTAIRNTICNQKWSFVLFRNHLKNPINDIII